MNRPEPFDSLFWERKRFFSLILRNQSGVAAGRVIKQAGGVTYLSR